MLITLVKGKFILILASSTILFILVVLFLPQTGESILTPDSSPSQFFGQLLEKLEPDKPIILIAVGDVMLGRSVNAKIRSLNDFDYPFLKTADFLRSADLTFINLESPFYTDCPTTNTGMIFCADPRAAEGLVFAGIDIANLANNHIRNYGQRGINLTQGLLQESNISFLNHQENLLIKEVRGTEFGFLGFDLISGYQEEKIIEVVKEIRLQADILIVSFHWGAEYGREPTLRQIEFAHQVIDAGADLILGHHPHVIQKIEKYHSGTIVYSLGNFVFDQPWSEATKKGLVGIFTFQDKKLIKSEFREVYIQGYSQPEFSD